MYESPCERHGRLRIVACRYSSIPPLFTLMVPWRVLQDESCEMETQIFRVYRKTLFIRQVEHGQWSLAPIISSPTLIVIFQKAGTIQPSFCATVLDDESSLSPESEIDLKWTANSMYAGSADTVRAFRSKSCKKFPNFYLN